MVLNVPLSRFLYGFVLSSLVAIMIELAACNFWVHGTRDIIGVKL